MPGRSKHRVGTQYVSHHLDGWHKFMARWTIQRQFLYPVLAIVALVTLATTLATVSWNLQQFGRRDREHARQIVETLAGSGFPMTAAVLQQMSGLSGAQFAVVSPEQVDESTQPWSPAERQSLLDWTRHAVESGEAQATLLIGEHEYLVDRVPIRDRGTGEPPRQLIVLSSRPSWWSTVREAAITPTIIAALGCVVLMVTIAWLSQRVVGPLLRLKRQAEHIAQGDFQSLELPRHNDEVYELASAINTMVDQLQLYEQRVREQERLQTLGQLAGGLAHHLRNAATGARLALELHQRACPLGREHEDLNVARRQLTLMQNYLQRLLVLGRDEPAQLLRADRPLDLAPVVEQVVELLAPMMRHAQVDFAVHFDDRDLSVWFDESGLEQLITNLALNALDAVKNLPAAQRRVELKVTASAEQVTLVVRDWGPGLSEAAAGRLFEPFASDKPDGVGLGLAVVRMLVEAQRGTVHYQREQLTTAFIVHMVRVTAEKPHGPAVGH